MGWSESQISVKGHHQESTMEVQQYGGKPYDRFYDTMVRWEAARAIRWRRMDAQCARMDAQCARTDAELAGIKDKLKELETRTASLSKRVKSLQRGYFYRPIEIFRCRPASKPSHCHPKAAPRSYRRQIRNKKLGRWWGRSFYRGPAVWVVDAVGAAVVAGPRFGTKSSLKCNNILIYS